jgi:ribonuclease HI
VSSNGKFKSQSDIAEPSKNFSETSDRQSENKVVYGKRSLGVFNEASDSDCKRIKSTSVSLGRHVNEKGFSVNEHSYYEVYTDGACTKNGKKGAKAGIGVFWSSVSGSQANSLNLSEPVKGDRATNNVGERQAITCCIKQAIEQGIDKLLVYSDSQFTISCVEDWMPKWKRNGWKKVDGQDVINKIDLEDLDLRLKEARTHNIQIKFQHIRGHHGIAGNEAADRLAVAGAKMHRCE